MRGLFLLSPRLNLPCPLLRRGDYAWAAREQGCPGRGGTPVLGCLPSLPTTYTGHALLLRRGFYVWAAREQGCPGRGGTPTRGRFLLSPRLNWPLHC